MTSAVSYETSSHCGVNRCQVHKTKSALLFIFHLFNQKKKNKEKSHCVLCLSSTVFLESSFYHVLAAIKHSVFKGTEKTQAAVSYERCVMSLNALYTLQTSCFSLMSE